MTPIGSDRPEAGCQACCSQAQDDGRDRAGEQDGPADLGDFDEEQKLQGSGSGGRDMMLMSNR